MKIEIRGQIYILYKTKLQIYEFRKKNSDWQSEIWLNFFLFTCYYEFSYIIRLHQVVTFIKLAKDKAHMYKFKKPTFNLKSAVWFCLCFYLLLRMVFSWDNKTSFACKVALAVKFILPSSLLWEKIVSFGFPVSITYIQFLDATINIYGKLYLI